MSLSPLQSSQGTPADPPVLATAKGRTVVLAVVCGSIVPLVVLYRYADPAIQQWAQRDPTTAPLPLWRVMDFAGSPATWLVASVLGFGVAAAFNWVNTARWMGMIAFGILCAGLVDIAVMGRATGAATPGAVAMVLSLWHMRWWPVWASLAVLCVLAEILVEGASGSQAATGFLAGALAALAVEYAWHSAAPDSPPVRNAPVQS